jgi:LytS/YehU family sensor histidine kinase
VDWQVVTTSTLIIMICVLFITHVYETVFLVKQTESERVRSEQLERARAESELMALKNQIDPHFMFNSLNTLSCLIEEAPLKALEFNEHLADVYRYILQNKSRQLVMVREELLFLEDYFALQKIRYGKSVQLQADIPTAVRDHYLMPPISLQLLAENAFKHNEFTTSSPLCLHVTVEDDVLLVRNPVHRKKKANPSHHIGLRNLQERYLLLTGKPIQVLVAELHFTVRLPLLKIQ